MTRSLTERHAVERSQTRALPSERPLRRLRVAPRGISVQGHVGVDLRIDLFDPGEDRVHDLDRRDLFASDQRDQLGGGQPAQIVGHDYLPRSRGSSVSRRASPSRFEPKTARLMAMPGKSTSQGAFWANSAAETDSIRPHDGYGSGTPRPRKESAASTRMALPSCAVV